MFTTTWFRDSPGLNTSSYTLGSFAGWHTMILVVSEGEVKYYDGDRLLATHGGQFYPRSPMNIVPQLWFYELNVDSTWHIDVDWLYYAQDTVLTAAEVEAHVAALRQGAIARQDTVN